MGGSRNKLLSLCFGHVFICDFDIDIRHNVIIFLLCHWCDKISGCCGAPTEVILKVSLELVF